jgi:putative oxidoreductase
MPAFFTFGRVLFAVLFIYTGATKLFGIQQTADFIASKVTIPTLIAPYTSQLETMTGMPMPQLLALSIGGFEIIAGLMIAVNFGARFFAILLIFFVLTATFYFHDFWNQASPENARTLIDALKNLSIIGALFMIAGYGRGPRPNEPAYGEI